jgi:DNA (cytosine-5)-methyltransferase 1
MTVTNGVIKGPRTITAPKIHSGSKAEELGVRPRVLSFFTGCGGLDLGFEQAGFETVYATDIDQESCNTLGLNIGIYFNKDMVVERSDIRAVNPRSLPMDIDLVIGGPPCQSFSASGRRAGGAAGRLDERGQLFESYCNIIKNVRPKAFVFENVRGILGTNKGEDWKEITKAFGKLGYTISYRLLDALDYGAPQQRERMFLVGHQLDRPFLFPEPTHGPDSFDGRPHVTAGKAFEGIIEDEDLEALQLSNGKYAHLFPLVPPGQNYLYFTAQRGYPRPIFAYRSRFSDFLYKANPEAPVKTIIASPGKYTGPMHWNNRYFSVREYMRLQGFPDEFKFSGNRVDVVRQIGNSVSPHISYQLARAIAFQIFGVNIPVRLLDADRVLSFDSRKGAKARKTRDMHSAIVKQALTGNERPFFNPSNYTAIEESAGIHAVRAKVRAVLGVRGVSLRVYTDDSDEVFAKMELAVRQAGAADAVSLKLNVTGFGRDPGTIQAMWNAVDEWVRRSSDFHSLFELYGHFTEPHPLFSVVSFSAVSDHPVACFAEHAANFSNCSHYFPKEHLVSLFSHVLKTDSFAEIADYLRRYRFDIRSKETNIAIGQDQYMVAYPFNLPSRRQMNFKLHQLEQGPVVPRLLGVPR